MPTWSKSELGKSSGKLPKKSQWHSDDEPSDADDLSDPGDMLDAGIDEILEAIAELRELLLKLLTKPSAASVN